ncbi:MAG: lysophospholipid acyltransferase family protein [bacterium]|nr:lysophospholipid acyltransferase family protein [bacterium]
MKDKKGIYLHEKPLKVQWKVRLVADAAFAYLHQLDANKRLYEINKPAERIPAIYALWHGYQWGLGLFEQEIRPKTNILISKSNDGEIIARLCDHLGFSLIRGSMRRGGDTALREMITSLENGESIAFTVDGPKGPCQQVKKGLIKLAKLSKKPIIPFVPYTGKKISFNSWDKCQVPTRIFLKASIIYGNPIYVPEDADDSIEEEYRQKVENYMFELEKDLIIEHKQYWRE